MFKKLVKIIAVIVALYLIYQIPTVNNFVQDFKNDALEKKNNVTEEYERVKDKVTETKETVDETIDTVNETVDKVGEAVNQVGEAVNQVGNLLGKDEKETSEEESVKKACTEEQRAAEICTMDYTPVCGNDGKTYGNACSACASGNIDAYTPGECESE